MIGVSPVRERRPRAVLAYSQRRNCGVCGVAAGSSKAGRQSPRVTDGLQADHWVSARDVGPESHVLVGLTRGKAAAHQ